MSVSIQMIAPGAAANVKFVSDLTGNSYTSNANGIITCLAQDANAAEAAGFLPFAQKAQVTLAVSTAINAVYVVPGAVNNVPASTVALLNCNLAAPTINGQVTNIVSVSTGNFVITASGCTIYAPTSSACTVLTCNTGTADLLAVGSTAWQILSRSPISNTSAAIAYGIASS